MVEVGVSYHSTLGGGQPHDEFSVLDYIIIDRGRMKPDTLSVYEFDTYVETTDRCQIWTDISRGCTAERQVREKVERRAPRR